MFKDQETESFVVSRLLNPNRAAEGPTLPPPNRGGARVPIIKNLSIPRTQRYAGGTQFTLVWDDPEEFRNQIDHFNIYAFGLYDDEVTPQGPWQCSASPSEVQIDANAIRQLTLIVQTELKNGLKSPLEISPSVGVNTLVPSAEGLTYPDESVPLDALSPWGTLNYILSANGSSSPPTWKSRGTLDLVEGRSTLIISGVPVVSNASGDIRQVVLTDIDDTDSPYTQLVTDHTLLCDASAGAVTVNLLTTVSAEGREITIKKTDASLNAVTVAPAGSETLEGELDGTILLEGESWTLRSDGANWRLV